MSRQTSYTCKEIAVLLDVCHTTAYRLIHEWGLDRNSWGTRRTRIKVRHEQLEEVFQREGRNLSDRLPDLARWKTAQRVATTRAKPTVHRQRFAS